MQICTVERVYGQQYSLGRQSISLISFTVIAWSKVLILGRQPFCAVPTWLTAQVWILVLLPMLAIHAVHSEDLSDQADAPTDLSLWWASRSCLFYIVMAQPWLVFKQL